MSGCRIMHWCLEATFDANNGLSKTKKKKTTKTAFKSGNVTEGDTNNHKLSPALRRAVALER